VLVTASERLKLTGFKGLMPVKRIKTSSQNKPIDH